ncbi:MAG: phage holin family protein [Caulobacter sp.]
MSDTETRSIPQLLGAFTSDLTTLLRKESELVRAEFSEKLGGLAKGGGELAAGAICLMAALIVLLQALVMALSKVMDPVWAALLVGLAVAALGGVLLKAGVKTAKISNLTPDRTIRQVEKDINLAKEQVQ